MYRVNALNNLSSGGRRWVRCALILTVLLSEFATGQETPRSVLPGPHAEGMFSAAQPSERAQPQRRLPPSQRPVPVLLEPVAATDLNQEMLTQSLAQSVTPSSSLGVPLKIGFSRNVPTLGTSAQMAAQWEWVAISIPLSTPVSSTIPGGSLAAISVTSPDALGMRLGLLVEKLPPLALLRFYAQGVDLVFEVTGQEIMESITRNLAAGDTSDEAHTYWSPLIDGSEITVEIELPVGVAPDEAVLSIPRVSHLFSSPLNTRALQEKIGSAASCEQDVMCYTPWDNESLATAKITFTESGASYLCTGSLLIDGDSSTKIPYFLSANHCISTQTVASTLSSYWFYRASSCNSGSLSPSAHTLTGGATLLYANSATDTSFMRLNSTPPAGAWYSGWSANLQVLNAAVTGIHHPKGDLQKISFATITGYLNCSSGAGNSSYNCTSATSSKADHLEVVWSQGVTEGGSSGSGLWVTSGASHYLVGQLNGGYSSCSNRTGSDEYGRFDVAYNAALYRWLGAASSSSVTLTVARSGTGSGTVSSTSGSINCGNTCSASLSTGTLVTLSATPASGSLFSGWSGACSGTGTCQLTLNMTQSVTATFNANLPVVEFYNILLDHYFITANASEAAAIDNGSAGSGWSRTGNHFNAGGSMPVCRFYGSPSPGPNSHFYTVDPAECASLQALQASTPTTQKRWNFEGNAFNSTPPISAVCQAGSVPVYRAYNNGFAHGVDSNHRIVSSLTALQEVVSHGWINEGIVMCAPP